MITLYHHPFSRAAGTLWALEEVGQPYELAFVDIMKGGQKAPEILAINPMGKLPTLTDGDVVVAEAAAIALYLADRYASGTLAPKLDDPRRATYLRWSFYAPSVIEPGATAKLNKWEFKPGQVGWGDFASMIAAMEYAIAGKQFILGDTFSIADVVFGGTVRFMLQFKMIEPTPTLSEYVDRLNQRPALQRADARNAAITAEHGLNK
jgi:glutathione S-transferase